MSLTRDARVLGWVHTDPGELDPAPEQPSDDEYVERAAKHLPCRRFDCGQDALAPLVVATVLGPRWVDVCLDCSRLLAREIGEVCARPGCDRAAPPDRSRGGWCAKCCGRLHSTLAGSTGLREELLASLVPSSESGGAPVSGSKEPPAPLRVGVLSTAEQLTAVMCACEDWLRSVRRDRPAQRTRTDQWGMPHAVPPGERWQQARGYVLGAWLQLLDTDDGRGLAQQLLSMAASASRVLGRDRLVHQLEAPCPSCNMLSLRRHDGSDRVECEMCGRTETEDTYAWLAKAAAVAYDSGDTGRVRGPVSTFGDGVLPREFGTGRPAGLIA